MLYATFKTQEILFTYHEYADEEDPGKTYRLRYVLK